MEISLEDDRENSLQLIGFIDVYSDYVGPQYNIIGPERSCRSVTHFGRSMSRWRDEVPAI